MEVKPGYKHTEVGVIPEDWRVAPITSLLEKGARITYGVVQPGSNDPTGVLFVRGGDIFGGKILTSQLRRIPKSVSAQFARTRLGGGEIVVSLVGYPGEAAIVPHWLADANIARQVALIRLGSTQPISSEYVCKFLQSNIGRRLLLNETIGSAQQVINLRDINKVRVVLPPTKAEQDSIAGALSDADALIESLVQLVAKKRQIKHGTMQQLLIGQKRLPGFAASARTKHTELGEIPQDWGVTTVSDEFTIQLGKMLDSEKNVGVTKPFLGNRAVQWGRFDLDDIGTIKLSPADLTKFRLREGDLLVCEGGEIGRAAIWTCQLEECYFQKALHRLRPKRGYQIEFMLNVLHRHASTGFLLNFVTQTSIAHLPKDKFQTVPIPLPPTPAEQEAIAAILSDMDAEIAGVEAKLAKARQVMQGMMQELLTGKTRLV